MSFLYMWALLEMGGGAYFIFYGEPNVFSSFQHHCRNCGDIFCDKCTRGRIALTADDNAQNVRVCD